MAEPFTGEIRIWACTFPPKDWALCDGTKLSVTQNTALYSLIGATYGGDGRINFSIPDFMDHIPIHQGRGTGLTPRRMGAFFGYLTNDLAVENIPAHNHTMYGEDDEGSTASPNNTFTAEVSRSVQEPIRKFYGTAPPNITMSGNALTNTGGNQIHTNTMPTLPMRYYICLKGVYPSRG